LQAPSSYGELFDPLPTKMDLKSPLAFGRSCAVGATNHNGTSIRGRRRSLPVLCLLRSKEIPVCQLGVAVHFKYVTLGCSQMTKTTCALESPETVCTCTSKSCCREEEGGLIPKICQLLVVKGVSRGKQWKYQSPHSSGGYSFSGHEQSEVGLYL
jgi:hypothetical protein